jgi:thiamine biosynthesis lipoprotein
MRRVVLVAALAALGCDRTPSGAAASASPASSGSAPEKHAAPPPFAPLKVSVGVPVMGTHMTLTAFTSREVGEDRVKAAFERAIAEVKRIESLMTTWRPDSEVSRINAEAGKAPVHVGPETFEVVQKSLWSSRLSDGAFDVTFEAMHGLWKFDEDLDPHPPSAADVAARRKLIDYRHLVVDPKAQTVLLDKAGMKMSLGGIAKGYAIDQAARVLAAADIHDFLAQAGGDLYVHGAKPDGSPWIVGVRDPRGPEGSYFASIAVKDHAFSTAGDYERAYVVGGKRYHHIIDPRTGYPATASRSVTIWAKDALTADAIDDAVFILGAEKGLALVESLDDCGAVIVDKNDKVWISKRLEGLVHVDRPPTDGL